MALMTAQEYIESLRKLNTRVYMFGEKIENWVDHPMIRPSINCVAMTYELAQNPEYADLMTVTSNLTGKKVNRFTHLHQSTEDLMNKVKMQRLLGQKTASCFQRCVGMDAFNAVFSTTYEIDEKYNTKYHENFVNFLKFVQDNDLTVDGAMTDPKGNRGLAPYAQKDPDMFLRVVERREDGIVVPLMAIGAIGVISVWSNVAPADVHDMCAAFSAGDLLRARELQLKAQPLVDALFSEVNPIPVKKALNLMGLEVGPLRSPLTEMTPENAAKLAEAMKNYGIKLA